MATPAVPPQHRRAVGTCRGFAVCLHRCVVRVTLGSILVTAAPATINRAASGRDAPLMNFLLLRTW